jgi:hypothetical protein
LISEQSFGTEHEPVVHFAAVAGQSALVVQPKPHAPSMHFCAPEQVVPHAPQLRLSVLMFAQTAWPPAAHCSKPAPHDNPHVPAEQTRPASHCLPQVPQFDGSTAASTHDCPHLVVPAPHVSVHAPEEQTWLASHFVPQAPQFSGSLAVDAQAEPHWVVPAPHDVEHAPLEQSSPVLHALPQAPQLARSLDVSTHVLPHAFLLPSHVDGVLPASLFDASGTGSTASLLQPTIIAALETPTATKH